MNIRQRSLVATKFHGLPNKSITSFMNEIDHTRLRNGVYRLCTHTTLPVSRSSAFEFFADAANLEAITPPWLHFHIVTPLPIEMEQGTLIDYGLKVRGIPMRWRTEISAWEPPFRFVDRQLRGPYRLWEHTHEFEETEDGTRMRDTVDYSVLGGALIEPFLVRPDLRRIFTYRNAQIRAHFGVTDAADEHCS